MYTTNEQIARRVYRSLKTASDNERKSDPILAFHFKGKDDFILMRYLDSGTAGGLSGFMDEVIRVSRYELRQGRWNSEPGKPELRMQWAGGDAFVLDRQIAPTAPTPAMGL